MVNLALNTFPKQSEKLVVAVGGGSEMIKTLSQGERTGETFHFAACRGFGLSARQSFRDCFSAICACQMLPLPSVLKRSFPFPCFPRGPCKNLPLLRQCHRTKVKTEEEEVDLPVCVFASPLILLGICEFPTTVFLKL